MFLQAGRRLNQGLKALIIHNEKTPDVLEDLVDELHNDKELCSYQLLNHPGSEDILWGIIRLLASKDPSVAGHAAYVIGTLCDVSVGRQRILEIVVAYKDNGFDVLVGLTKLLYCRDGESLMNAAGTIGTLAETIEGRSWMLRKDALDETLTRISSLLASTDMWTASNAALVIARLTIEEEGCARILNRRDSKKILLQLLSCLGNDEAGRGMNAAFAIGRLCDMESGRRQILMLNKSNQMLVDLTSMLCSQDGGGTKNACFALGCIAGGNDGVIRLLNHPDRDVMLQRLANMLDYEDEETAWFAAMTLRTLSSKKEGCLLLRNHKIVTDALKETLKKETLKDDIKEEITVTLEIIKHLEKPKCPTVKIESSTTANVHWPAANPKSGLEVTYIIFQNDVIIFRGQETSFEVQKLKPTTHYGFKLQSRTEGDESPISDVTWISMPESVPSAPQNVHIINRSTSQLKIGWEAPDSPNGVVRGYQIYQKGKSGFAETQDFYHIFMNLIAGTEYCFEVYALTSKGRGEKSLLTCETVDRGEHAPSKPNLHVLGRNEIMVQWNPPEEPLGRINYYEVKMDGVVIYTGIERNCTARRLLPKTEYTFMVAAWTNEGRCDSKPAKTKTAKDKRVFPREPLYPSRKQVKNGKVTLEKGYNFPAGRPPKQRSKSVPFIRSATIYRDTAERPKTSVQITRNQTRNRVDARMNVVKAFSMGKVDNSSEKRRSSSSKGSRRRHCSAGSLANESFRGEKEHIPVSRSSCKQPDVRSPPLNPKMKDTFIGLSFRPGSFSPIQKSPLKFSYSHNDATAIKSCFNNNHTKTRKSISFGNSFSHALTDLKTIHQTTDQDDDVFQPK